MRQRIAWLLLGLIVDWRAQCGANLNRLQIGKSSILVFDHDRLAQSVDGEAEREARGIFRRAGIDMLWRNCSVPSEIPRPGLPKNPPA